MLMLLSDVIGRCRCRCKDSCICTQSRWRCSSTCMLYRDNCRSDIQLLLQKLRLLLLILLLLWILLIVLLLQMLLLLILLLQLLWLMLLLLMWLHKLKKGLMLLLLLQEDIFWPHDMVHNNIKRLLVKFPYYTIIKLGNHTHQPVAPYLLWGYTLQNPLHSTLLLSWFLSPLLQVAKVRLVWWLDWGPLLPAFEVEVEGGRVRDHGVGVTLVEWKAWSSSSPDTSTATGGAIGAATGGATGAVATSDTAAAC